MSTSTFLLLAALIVLSGAVLVINLAGPRKSIYDYWNLDNEDDTPPTRLDVLRTNVAFYAAGIVFVCSACAYLWLRHL
ncbi:hypothetical protein [Paraburkholderia tropica]|uniref:hypothetical protein n=1 Tax=Paraburkholderia tropica TaxID=92647 RepID=UPI002AB0394F|nr:hypothetical protein [Paraburkholderia tropica]